MSPRDDLSTPVRTAQEAHAAGVRPVAVAAVVPVAAINSRAVDIDVVQQLTVVVRDKTTEILVNANAL